MTYDEIIKLGWKPRHAKSDDSLQTFFYDIRPDARFIMAVLMKPEEDELQSVSIKFADEKVKVNEWENSDPVFHGYLKTKADLHAIMRFSDIIEYENKRSATVRVISHSQISELRQMFLDETTIEKIGRVDETAALIVSYRGGRYDYEGFQKTKSIPYKEDQA